MVLTLEFLFLPVYCTSRLHPSFFEGWCSPSLSSLVYFLLLLPLIIMRIWSWLARLSPISIPLFWWDYQVFIAAQFLPTAALTKLSVIPHGCFQASQRVLWMWKCRWIDRRVEKHTDTPTDRSSIVVVCWKHAVSQLSACLSLLLTSDKQRLLWSCLEIVWFT